GRSGCLVPAASAPGAAPADAGGCSSYDDVARLCDRLSSDLYRSRVLLEPPSAGPGTKRMRALAAYQSLGTIDLLSVARDPLLRWTIVLTLALGLLIRFAVPPVAAGLEARFGFDLAAFYPLIMSFLPLAVAGMTGTVVGFLLLDQRDDDTLSALLVTPLRF